MKSDKVLLMKEPAESDMEDTPNADRSRGNVLSELHSILLEMDRLKQVVRQNPIASGARRETTAEHSWHLALSVVLFSRFAAESVDINQAVLLAIVHDIPEVFVGDTFVYSPRINLRHRNEVAAMKALVTQHRELHEIGTIVEKWNEYESCLSPEGRFVMAMDVLLPVFLNFANVEHSSWLRHGVTDDQVRSRIEGVREYCPDVAEFAMRIVDQAVNQGALRNKSQQ